MNPEVEARSKELITEDLKLGSDEIRNRLLSRFVNEAVLCLQDDVLENPGDGDIGAVFGCGFLPYTGGPFRMLDAVGIGQYTDMMQGFADKYVGHTPPNGGTPVGSATRRPTLIDTTAHQPPPTTHQPTPIDITRPPPPTTHHPRYGEQFEPCQLMKDMARDNKKFYK